jgi:S-methylmethionine-dependent homocysteine/selenocysteine methylase
MNHPLGAQLSQHPLLILDGAMGTELQRQGIDVGLPLWSARALLSDPDSVLWIHQQYILAGADIITTNTFRTTSRTFARAGLPDRSALLTRQAVDLAFQARSDCAAHTVLIAGSIAPLEDCYRPDLVPDDAVLVAEHTEQARRLAQAGVDFLLLETMGTIREAEAASSAASRTGKEFVVSFLCRPDGRLYGGESIADAVSAIAHLNPAAFSLNCISPHVIQPALRALRNATPLPTAVYANAGKAGYEQAGELVVEITPDDYASFATGWQQEGVRIIGGCCGTSAVYIECIREKLQP